MNRTTSVHQQIFAEWKEFQSTWQDVQVKWKDDVAEQFQNRFMSQFESEVPVLLSQLDLLREEIKRAHRELRS